MARSSAMGLLLIFVFHQLAISAADLARSIKSVKSKIFLPIACILFSKGQYASLKL
jgi:hypothetical protein